jgi:hypothetical protein
MICLVFSMDGTVSQVPRDEASAFTCVAIIENAEMSSRNIIAEVNIFFNFLSPLPFSVLFSYAAVKI